MRAQRPSSTHRLSGAQPPPNVPHASSGVIKAPSQIATLQQRQQLLQEAQTTYDIQVRKRQTNFIHKTAAEIRPIDDWSSVRHCRRPGFTTGGGAQVP